MEFSVGDYVVHPKHGAGQITGTRQLELVEGYENYYVIKIGDNGLTLHVPMRKMEELGVRPVMSRSRLTRVLDTLHETPRQLSTNFKTRQARIKEKLQTGMPLKMAEAVRDLAARRQRAKLSANDTRLLNRCQELLAMEIALVTDTELIDAHQKINTILAEVET